jgi:hypothetical protein
MTTSSTAIGEPSAHRTLASPALLGGLGGLLFVISVVLQNAIRAGFPGNDAGAASIISYYAAHRGASITLGVLYPIGGVGLVAFLAAILTRISETRHRSLAIVGAFGAAGIVCTYTMLIATDLGLAGYIHRGGAEAGVVAGLWTMHNAVFGVLLAAIGIALLGLSAATAAAGLLPGWWSRLGLAGGVLLLVAAATTPAIVDGSATMLIGLAGFVVWLAFVVSCSVALLRSGDERP